MSDDPIQGQTPISTSPLPCAHAGTDSPSATLGTSVGAYRLAGVLGHGGAGVVYEAVDPLSQRRVAIKRLSDDLARDPRAVEAFLADTRAADWLGHPNIVAVEEVEQRDGACYLITEFVSGGSAADRLAALGRQPWREATRVVADACRGLAAAHAAGVVHGDIKPSNLLISHGGAGKVADFGQAAAARTTPDYLSPEQLHGEPIDARSDIYSLGATYYALLAGRPPFAGTATHQTGDNGQPKMPPVRAGAPEMPLRCEVIVRRAMAPDPADRYPSAEAMLADLEAVLAADAAAPAPRPPRLVAPRPARLPAATWRTRLRPVVGPGSAVAALAVLGYFVLSMRPTQPGSKSSDPSDEAPPAAALPVVTNSVGMKLARVPPGDFLMGDPIIPDAQPHVIRISHGFLVGVHEVTQLEYQLVTGTNPSQFRGESLPVEQVTWDEARAFCAKLSDRPEEKALGRVYRLPTEAEWEYCCRAGTGTSFNRGRQLTPRQANTLVSGFQRPTPVGTYPPNLWGLYDLHGNVGEWCSDWYGAEYYVVSPVIDPAGPTEGTKRVVRGGSWCSPPDDARSGYRCDAFAPDARSPAVGFRVVCTEAAGGL
jgi:formylglycine-generating enzyme required for sulfatase activity